ncbi:hypothetical protein D3C71_1828160 [compost metagenome]
MAPTWLDLAISARAAAPAYCVPITPFIDLAMESSWSTEVPAWLPLTTSDKRNLSTS